MIIDTFIELVIGFTFVFSLFNLVTCIQLDNDMNILKRKMVGLEFNIKKDSLLHKVDRIIKEEKCDDFDCDYMKECPFYKKGVKK